MNNVHLSGNLGNDLTIEEGKSGKPFVRFKLVIHNGKNRDPIWARCVTFGSSAEYLVENAKKGNRLIVSGSISNWKHFYGDGTFDESLSILVTNVTIGIKPKRPYPKTQVDVNHVQTVEPKTAEPNFN